MRKRWKRKSGYTTPGLTISCKDLLNEDLFITPYYDDWEDWRDGQRDLPRFDKSTYRREWKQKKSVKLKLNPKWENSWNQTNNPFFGIKSNTYKLKCIILPHGRNSD